MVEHPCILRALTSLLVFILSSVLTPAEHRKVAMESVGAPSVFEENKGQANSNITFLSRGAAYAVLAMPSRLTVVLSSNAAIGGNTPGNYGFSLPPEIKTSEIVISFVGSDPGAEVVGWDERVTKSHYLVGNQRSDWRTNIPTYGGVKYLNLYEGIDLILYGRAGQIEFDFRIAPGVSPDLIHLKQEGGHTTELNREGDLVITTEVGSLSIRQPLAYQSQQGNRIPVPVRFAMTKQDLVGFEVGDHDSNRILVIDPVLEYATTFGFNGHAQAIAVDSQGAMIVAGWAAAYGFQTQNPLQPVHGGLLDAFVSKFDPSGSTLLFSTFLGGNDYDWGDDVAVDQYGNIYLAGSTRSSDFPVEGAFQPRMNGESDAFVAKLNPAGSSLIYSTYLGGSGAESETSMTLDADGGVFLVGRTESRNFPIFNAFQASYGGGYQDAFAAKLDPTASILELGSYLGGEGFDRANDIVTGLHDSVYITGSTSSQNLHPLCRVVPGGHADAFVLQLNHNGSVARLKCIGGSGSDEANSVAIHPDGSITLVGTTTSQDLPLLEAFQEFTRGGSNDGFVARLNDAFQPVFTTYLGGCGTDFPAVATADAQGAAYVIGYTNSEDFPLKDAFQPTIGGELDGFVTMVSGAQLIYSSFLGGPKSDWANDATVPGDGSVYITGSTNSGPDFPVVNPFQTGFAHSFLAKVSTAAAPETMLSVADATLSIEDPAGGENTHLMPWSHLPLSFEPNLGQAADQVDFLARGPGYFLFLAGSETVIVLGASRKPPAIGGLAETAGKGETSKPNQAYSEIHQAGQAAAVRMQFVGANPAGKPEGKQLLAGRSHYFVGNQPEHWLTSVPHFARVVQENVYPGIDLHYYGRPGHFEYDLVVSPGGDPKAIRIRFDGAEEVQLNSEGDLVIGCGSGSMLFRKPTVYQDVRGRRRQVTGGYQIREPEEIAFVVGPFDRRRPLIIDPVLVYSTYLGGRSEDIVQDIGVDGDGQVYVVGATGSPDFPLLKPVQPSFRGGWDAFISKFHASGSSLLWSTYIGGRDDEAGNAVAVDAEGYPYLVGSTLSTDFPVVGGVQPTAGGGCDLFVTKLEKSGARVLYSTYLGGSKDDSCYGGIPDLAVDESGQAYVTSSTRSPDLPTVRALQPDLAGGTDVMVAVLNPAGNQLNYLTYLGGHGDDSYPTSGFAGIAIDSDGSAYLTGSTSSPDFPTVRPFQSRLAGDFDAFVAKLSTTESVLSFSSYVGGKRQDYGHRVGVDNVGHTYVFGTTTSEDFPIIQGIQSQLAGTQDTFLMKIIPGGETVVYSTYLGGCGADSANGLAVRPSGEVYVTGATSSVDYPITLDGPQTALAGGFLSDAFLTGLNSGGTSWILSSFLGGRGNDTGTGVTLDSDGNIYIAGMTSSVDFPTVHPFQDDFGGRGFYGGDAFVAKIGNVSVRRLIPNLASPGSRITIIGSGFLGKHLEVLFNGIPGIDIEVLDDNTIRVTVPNLPPGPIDVKVRTAEGSAVLSGEPDGLNVSGPIPTLSPISLLLLLALLSVSSVVLIRNNRRHRLGPGKRTGG